MRHWIVFAALALSSAACGPSAEVMDDPPARLAVGGADVPRSAPAKEAAPSSPAEAKQETRTEGANAVRFSGSVCVVLDDLFNNDAIASKKNPRDGNFDIPDRRSGDPPRGGDTFPWVGMPEGGEPFAPQKSGKLEGVAFAFPRYVDGMTNNVACGGQTVSVDPGRYSALHVLGASEGASQESTLTLLVGQEGDGGGGSVDGREAKVPFRLTDWCQPARYGEAAVLRWSHRIGPDGWRDDTPCAIFVQTVELPREAVVRGIRLPENPRMHVFALTLQRDAQAASGGRAERARVARLDGTPVPAPGPDEAAVTLADTSGSQPGRWADVAGNPYSAAYNAGHSYGDATVRVVYRKRASTFTGRLTASGLKPNFAYQVKLLGDRADRWSFETIGYLGRWLVTTDERGGTNFSDAQYRKLKDDPKAVIESYILFDYFVTDGEGKATKSLRLDSSFHVMWSRELNRMSDGPRPEDSEMFLHTVRPAGEAYWWRVVERPFTVGLWLEQEWLDPRPAKGQVKLPPGRYSAAVQLTEESFHKSRPGWARVLQGQVRFEVVREGERPPREDARGTE